MSNFYGNSKKHFEFEQIKKILKNLHGKWWGKLLNLKLIKWYKIIRKNLSNQKNIGKNHETKKLTEKEVKSHKICLNFVGSAKMAIKAGKTKKMSKQVFYLRKSNYAKICQNFTNLLENRANLNNY